MHRAYGVKNSCYKIPTIQYVLQSNPQKAFIGAYAKGLTIIINAQINEKGLSYALSPQYLTGVEGFEPSNNGFKVRCLSHLATPQDVLILAQGFRRGKRNIAFQLVSVSASQLLTEVLKC